MNTSDASQYTQSGNVTALAGLIVVALSYFGVNTTAGTIAAIIGGIAALVGVIKQIYTHTQLKNQALSAGAIK